MREVRIEDRPFRCRVSDRDTFRTRFLKPADGRRRRFHRALPGEMSPEVVRDSRRHRWFEPAVSSPRDRDLRAGRWGGDRYCICWILLREGVFENAFRGCHDIDCRYRAPAAVLLPLSVDREGHRSRTSLPALQPVLARRKGRAKRQTLEEQSKGAIEAL